MAELTAHGRHLSHLDKLLPYNLHQSAIVFWIFFVFIYFFLLKLFENWTCRCLFVPTFFLTPGRNEEEFGWAQMQTKKKKMSWFLIVKNHWGKASHESLGMQLNCSLLKTIWLTSFTENGNQREQFTYSIRKEGHRSPKRVLPRPVESSCGLPTLTSIRRVNPPFYSRKRGQLAQNNLGFRNARSTVYYINNSYSFVPMTALFKSIHHVSETQNFELLKLKSSNTADPLTAYWAIGTTNFGSIGNPFLIAGSCIVRIANLEGILNTSILPSGFRIDFGHSPGISNSKKKLQLWSKYLMQATTIRN